VSVVPVSGEDPVRTVQHRADANCGRLLTDAQMNRAPHLLLGIEVDDPLLNHANPNYVEEKATAQIVVKSHGTNQ
jgi:hypothetical protein